MAETWTIQRVLAWTSDYFKKKGLDAPRLTAELLLAHALTCDRVRLYMDLDRPLEKEELASYRALVERRAAGEPTFYILGAKEFFGRRFKIDKRVLTPRPETELVTEVALEKLPEDATGTVLDLCTGSGCIGLTLAAERPGLRVVAVDASADALEVARENAAALGVADRVELLHGDLYAPVAGRAFRLLVSNPPYVESGVIAGLRPEVRCEPRMALDGGQDGLDLLRRIVAGSPAALEPGSWVVLEIGEGQGGALMGLFTGANLAEPAIRKDLSGLERIALARRA
ncbi:MAG TPA: peptide chain release factor N(5)-glutamine methyltransferase [Myxococcales bacterium]